MMKSIGTGCTLVALVWTCQAPAQAPEWITIGSDVQAFHEDVFLEHRIRLEPPAVNDVEIFVELIGIPNFEKINELRLQIRRSIGLKNAGAYSGKGYRTIVYDPEWAVSATADFYLALGHEAGHHFCGHTDRSPSAENELQADRFGGASIKRFEVYHNRNFFAAVMAAAAVKYPERGGSSYPSRASRLEALRKGYEEGSPCGGLAPVERTGYSRGTR